MHPQAMEMMGTFVNKHLKKSKDLRIIDIGSLNVNGCYRQLFDNPKWQYTGADMCSGPNVDIVFSDPYHWGGIRDNTYDVVICGQVLEHTEFPWMIMQEISRIMKVGGICCIIAPQVIAEHKCPVDCWRIMPDGMRVLARTSGLDPVEIYDKQSMSEANGGLLIDTVMVAKKGKIKKIRQKKGLSELLESKKVIHLDIGCGNNRQGNYMTLDRDPRCKPDIVWDIQTFPWPIPDNICQTVLMSHIWEHIEPKYRVDVINEVWRIMKPGGQILLSSPYYQSFWASQDPTHYPCPNEATFTYFDPNPTYGKMWEVYRPKPWKLIQNNYTLDGNIEVIMEKVTDEKYYIKK